MHGDTGGHAGGHSFDERAATWDDPVKIEQSTIVAECIRRAVQLDASMRMLEYGAGTGLLTQALRRDVGPVTLADTSAGMRDVMAGKVASGDIAGARIWDVDLASQSAPDGEEFDLIVTVLALHHITELDRVLASFAGLLVEGGHLCVVDLEAEDGSFHGADFHGHQGFERSELAGHLERAGFADVEFSPCHHVVRDTGTFPMFLAVARRASGST